MTDKMNAIKVYLKQHISKFFLGCILSCAISLVICFVWDGNVNSEVEKEVKTGIQIEFKWEYSTYEDEEESLVLNADDFCSMVLTIDTIMAAAVIFFYSMIDNRKTGISHRTIMTYTVGSYMVPGLFLATIILLPIMYGASAMGMIATMWISIIFSYIFQLIIIVLILLSVSYNYSIRAVCYAEIGQFENMPNMDLEQDKKKMLFQIRHMEQVVISEDSSVEKAKMISALLKVPCYEKKNMYKVSLVPQKLCDLNEEHIYEYYYMNINSVFVQIKNDVEECQKMYNILYVFFDELWEIYNVATENLGSADERTHKAIENYRCIIAAILNAITEAGSINAIQFANQILQKQLYHDKKTLKNIDVKDDVENVEEDLGEVFAEENYVEDTNKEDVEEKLFNKQMGLYLCYLQFLFYVYTPYEGERREYMMVDIDEWEPDILTNIKYYEKYWRMWEKQVTISSKESCFYFWNILSIIRKEAIDGSPLCFAVNKKKELRSTNDSSSYRVSK